MKKNVFFPILFFLLSFAFMGQANAQCNCFDNDGFTTSISDCSVDFNGILDTPPFCFGGTGGATYQFDWDFGDGSTGNGQLASHTYAASGIYNVCFTITRTENGVSCAETICKDVKTECVDPCEGCEIDADFTYTVDGCNYCFSAVPVNEECFVEVTYSWILGNGELPTGQNVCTQYEDGNYIVILGVEAVKANGEICADKIWKEICVVGCEPECECNDEGATITADLDCAPSQFTMVFDAPDPSCIVEAGAFSWDFGNGQTAFSPGSSIEYNHPAGGQYEVCVTVSYQLTTGFCAITACQEFEVPSCFSFQKTEGSEETGIQSEEADLVRVFPNPNDGMATIDFGNIELTNDSRITIVDLNGRQVMEIPVTGVSAQQLDLSSLETGVYNLQVSSRAGVLINKQVVVQR